MFLQIRQIKEHLKEIDIYYIVENLHQHGYECNIVGGFVRDFFKFNKISKDVDFTTNATPDQLAIVFAGHKLDFVGKSFLVTLVDGIEIATYRKDIINNGIRTECEVEQVLTLEEDLSRRDLTINAIAIDLINDKIIDPFGGILDLANNIIRFVGVHPGDRIAEDHERILRVIRFKALLNGEFYVTTKMSMNTMGDLIKDVPKERIRLELMKTMKIQKASIFFRTLFEFGILQHIFPSLCLCNIDGGQHHNETVFEHSMDTGDNISCKYPLLKLAGYLHDIGKPLSIVDHKDGVTFVMHEKTGAALAEKELTDLKFSNKEIKYVSNVIRLHMRSMNRQMGKKALKRFLTKLESANVPYTDWLRLFIADKKANRKSRNFTFSEIRKFRETIKNLYVEEKVFSLKDIPINGNDIMQTLNIPQGKEIGIILKNIFTYCQDNPEQNDKEVLTRLLLEGEFYVPSPL